MCAKTAEAATAAPAAPVYGTRVAPAGWQPQPRGLPQPALSAPLRLSLLATAVPRSSEITALSTPPVQTGWQNADALEWPQNMRASEFLKFMRDTVGDIPWEDTEWQRRFESLRYHISAAWQRLDPRDQERLMRRFGWLWSLARFRTGPQAFSSAQMLLDAGQLDIVTDMVTGITTDEDGVHKVRLAKGDDLFTDTVINCSGAGRDPLVTRILDDEIAARHQTARHRPAMTGELALLRADGTLHPNLFGIGPMTSHVAGDVLGSASIARQARGLAARLEQ